MAVYPCAIGLHRYPGPQRSVYISDVSTVRPETRKLRLCERHYNVIAQAAQDCMVEITEDSQMSLVCETPGCDAARDLTIFVKLYPGGEDALHFASDVCGVHALDLMGKLSWNAGTAL